MEALRSAPEIESVDAQLFEPGKDWSYLADRELFLLGPGAAAEALARLRPPRLDAELAHARELLSMPSPQIKALVQQDPVGLLTMLRERMSRQKGIVAFDPTAGRLRQPGRPKPTGRGEAGGAPFDTDFCKTLFRRCPTWNERHARPSARTARRCGGGRHPGGRRLPRVARGRAVDSPREHRQLRRIDGPAAAVRLRAVSNAVGDGLRHRAARVWRRCSRSAWPVNSGEPVAGDERLGGDALRPGHRWRRDAVPAGPRRSAARGAFARRRHAPDVGHGAERRGWPR